MPYRYSTGTGTTTHHLRSCIYVAVLVHTTNGNCHYETRSGVYVGGNGSRADLKRVDVTENGMGNISASEVLLEVTLEFTLTKVS
jgi:hypothetical protein